MTELEKLRKEIDLIDENMVRLFEYRVDAIRKVAEYKAKNGLPTIDKEREKKVIQRNSKLIKNSNNKDLYSKFISDLLALSRGIQHEIVDNYNKD